MSIVLEVNFGSHSFQFYLSFILLFIKEPNDREKWKISINSDPSPYISVAAVMGELAAAVNLFRFYENNECKERLKHRREEYRSVRVNISD